MQIAKHSTAVTQLQRSMINSLSISLWNCNDSSLFSKKTKKMLQDRARYRK